MPRYEISLAYNVPCYATFEVDAGDEAEAIQQAVKEAEDTAFTPEWDGAECGVAPGSSEYVNEAYRLVSAVELTAQRSD